MKKQFTAFYLEAVMLIVVFGAVIMVLAGVFTAARAESARAAHLTRAVTLAQNAAEAVAASNDLEDVQDLLDKNGNAQIDDNVLTVTDDGYIIIVEWLAEGDVAYSDIAVWYSGETIYTLETAVCLQEAAG